MVSGLKSLGAACMATLRAFLSAFCFFALKVFLGLLSPTWNRLSGLYRGLNCSRAPASTAAPQRKIACVRPAAGRLTCGSLDGQDQIHPIYLLLEIPFCLLPNAREYSRDLTCLPDSGGAKREVSSL
jgi:hypothetical protein